MTGLLILAMLFSCSFAVNFEERVYRLCKVVFCDCYAGGHPSWQVINCTLSEHQKLDIVENDLPDTTTELTVLGGEAVRIHPHSLSRLQDLRLVRISHARHVLLRTTAAIHLNVVNAYIEIDFAETLKVEQNAFLNIRGPLTVTIKNCDSVTMEGDAFSWLLKISIVNVQNLMLSAGAFSLDPSAFNVGEHGPGMSIEIKNVSTTEFPANTFGSSAAEIVMESVVIQSIQSAAFSANTYNSIKASDCTFHAIQNEAFAQKSLINNLQFNSCNIKKIGSRALQSAITKLDISHTIFNVIETGAINATVATVRITDSEFHKFMSRGFELSSWNKMHLSKNKFDNMAPHAILAPTSLVHELIFVENEIEGLSINSFQFIGQTMDSKYALHVVYKDNYFGMPCNCNISKWLAKGFGSKNGDAYESGSYCTVNEFFARCFNEPHQNIQFKKFLTKVCGDKSNIECEEFRSKSEDGKPTTIKNPRFPHKVNESNGLSESDKKVIGIVVVTALGCIAIVMFITFIRCMKRRGYCARIKNFLLSSGASCGALCSGLCVCGRNNGLENARSISHISIHEFSERRRLNDPIVQELVVETALTGVYEENTPTDSKATQTLPEELTKELLERLKEKLDDPVNYVEAREMIEHLYELIKVDISCNTKSPIIRKPEENIYELPFQNTTPRLGKNKKEMVSIGTKTPSLDKLLPISPYNRQTALAHEYFEPIDFARHLYAEIMNVDREKRNLLGNIPDIVEQVVPRGPKQTSKSPSQSLTSPIKSPVRKNPIKSPTNSHSSPTNKSIASSGSSKMINRPLPEKPKSADAGEGTSAGVTLKG